MSTTAADLMAAVQVMAGLVNYYTPPAECDVIASSCIAHAFFDRIVNVDGPVDGPVETPLQASRVPGLLAAIVACGEIMSVEGDNHALKLHPENYGFAVQDLAALLHEELAKLEAEPVAVSAMAG